MMKLNFASLSLGASVDQQTGNLSVFDIIEDVRIPQLPVNIQSLVISLVLEKTQQQSFEGKVFIHLMLPDGNQQVVGTGDLRVPPEQSKLKAVFRFGNFPIAMFGLHRFVVSWVNATGAKVGEAILDFSVTQATQVAQGVAPSEKPPVSH